MWILGPKNASERKIVGPQYVSDYAARLCIRLTINLDTMQNGEKQSWSNQSR